MLTPTTLPERLVHGPLTAMMLLEIAALSYPQSTFKTFEYRAVNPIVVNRPVKICVGRIEDEGKVRVWAEETESDMVAMTGVITFAEVDE